VIDAAGCDPQALIRKYVPLAVVVAVVLFLLWFRARFYK
jgi:hypothetical protein